MNWVRKTKPALGLLVCIFFAIFLFSCTGASNAQMDTEAPMMVTLKVLDVSDKKRVSVALEFILKNNTTHAYNVLTWGTPLEGEFYENMFTVTKDGEQLPYIGKQVKRSAPQKNDFIEMGPKGELVAKISLERGYAIKDPGLYTVQYRKPYISMKPDHGEMQLVPVRSNRVEFKIGSN